jgi:hypothetical protein
MQIGKIHITTQYAAVVHGAGFGDAVAGIYYWLRGYKIYDIGRNYTSCGRYWYGWDHHNKRLNLWPFSIWF